MTAFFADCLYYTIIDTLCPVSLARSPGILRGNGRVRADGSVDFSGTTEPFPDHDQAIAGAGLTVY